MDTNLDALAMEALDRVARGEGSGEPKISIERGGKPNAPPSAPLVMSADTIPMRAGRWMWERRIARGTMCMLDGDPDLGKSTLLSDLTARITRGLPFPGETKGSTPAPVLIFPYEDDPSSTIVPRLKAAGADLSLVKLWDLDEHTFILPDNLGELVAIVEQVRPALVIIDPLSSALNPRVNTRVDTEVRRVLHPIKQLAARTDTVFIFVRHLNKTIGGSAIHRGGGSIAFIAAARTGLLLAPDPDDKESGRILAVTKCNTGKRGVSMRFRLVAAPPPAPGIQVARIEWGESTSIRADELVEDPKESQKAIVRATKFIRDMLGRGRMLATDAAAECAGAHISESTMNRAKADLSVKCWSEADERGRKKVWYWALPDARFSKPL